MAAFYRASLSGFLADKESDILGKLLESYPHQELQKRQTVAWKKEIGLLKKTSQSLLKTYPEAGGWHLLLEYPIPRRLKRLDAVILAADVILCLEFKTEDKVHSLQGQRQVEEYALDLRDFHEASKDRPIVPILVAPRTDCAKANIDISAVENVAAVQLAGSADLGDVIAQSFTAAHDPSRSPIDPESWDHSAYRPVPTIIEAAETLYAGHSVRDIASNHAGATNLSVTSSRLIEIIEQVQQNKEKVICFVTGVPGAGKTLVGLDAVHNRALRKESRPAGVFLSGNGPLVKIISAAIARDHKRRSKERGAERTVTTFIQNVHAFVDEGLQKSTAPPVEKVIVFDEAQRAWNAQQNEKKNGVEASEPDIVLSIMDRHSDWAVIVALVGGGQEIHSGEAGLKNGVRRFEKNTHTGKCSFLRGP